MRPVAALLGIAAVLAAAPGARAAPPWSPPAAIAGTAGALFPQLLFTRAGTALALADKNRPGRNAPIVGAVQAAGATRFGRARQLAPGDFEGGLDFGSFAPYGRRGVVALISRVHMGIRATIRPWLATGAPGHRLRLRRQLGAPHTFSLTRDLASNRRGDVAGLYITCNTTCSRQRLTLVAWPAGAARARLRHVVTLPANGQDYVQAAVALDRSGRLVVAYGNRRLVGARRGSVRGRLGRAQRLARVPRPVSTIAAAIGDGGAAVVGWAAQGVAATVPARFGAAVAAGARSRFGRTQALERWPAGAVESVRGTPIRAVAAGERLSLGWTGFQGGLYVTRLADVSGGAVGAPQTLSAPGLDVELSDLAAAPSGRAVAAVQAADPNGGGSAIAAAVRPAAAAFGPLVRVSGGSGQAGSARVALDPARGRAVAIWLDGRAPTLRAATLPPG